MMNKDDKYYKGHNHNGNTYDYAELGVEVGIVQGCQESDDKHAIDNSPNKPTKHQFGEIA